MKEELSKEMKKIIIITLLSCITFISGLFCIFYYSFPSFRSNFNPVIDQHIEKSRRSEGSDLYTIVLYKGDMVWGKLDDAVTLTDSLVVVRKKQANKFIKALNEIKK